MDYQERIIEHYKTLWNNEPKIHYWDKGPSNELPYNFRILEFSPTLKRDMWTYATCCMSQENDINKIELHIFSSVQDHTLIELLTVVAHYHRTSSKLALNHSINFGRPWQNNSKCEYGFISLPYLDGPDLEDLKFVEEKFLIKFYWLIPVTKKEIDYKKQFGEEALEKLFEDKGLDYINSYRNSLI